MAAIVNGYATTLRHAQSIPGITVRRPGGRPADDVVSGLLAQLAIPHP